MEQVRDKYDIGLFYLPDGRIIFNGKVYEPPEPGFLDLYCTNSVMDRINAMTEAENHCTIADPPLVFRQMYEYAEEEEETPDWFRPFHGLAPIDGPEPYQVRLATAKTNFYRIYRENYRKYIEEKKKSAESFIKTPLVAAAGSVKNKLVPIMAAGSSVKNKLNTAYGMLKNASKTEWGIGLGIGLTAGAVFSYFLLKK